MHFQGESTVKQDLTDFDRIGDIKPISGNIGHYGAPNNVALGNFLYAGDEKLKRQIIE